MKETIPAEPHELALAEISALIDGEADVARTLEVVDLLVDSEDAREFYRRSRALDGLVQAAATVPRVEAPAMLWERIAKATEQTPEDRQRARLALPARSSRLRVGGRTLLAAAAVILVGLAGWWTATSLRRNTEQDLSRRAEQLAQISIGSRAGDMNDDRFLELATEILEADRRYRREMLALIGEVESELRVEGSFEERRLGDLNEGSARRSYDQSEGGVRDDQVGIRLR